MQLAQGGKCDKINTRKKYECFMTKPEKYIEMLHLVLQKMLHADIEMLHFSL